MAMGMLLLSLSVGLIALGIARIIRILRERRADRLRSDMQAIQLVAAARLQYRLRLCLSCGESFTTGAFCTPCLIEDMQPVGGAL